MMREADGPSRRIVLAETAALVLVTGCAFVCVPRLLALLGVPPPVRPWAQPEAWVPDSVPRFPWADCLTCLVSFVALPLAFEWSRLRDDRRDAGICLPQGRLAWLTLALAILGLLAYQRVACWALGQRMPSLLTPENLAYFVGLWSCVAVSEEFFFRSVLQRRLATLWGQTVAIVVVGVTFAFALHWRAPVSENAIMRLPAALVFGWLFARQEGLLSPVLAHFVINLVSFA